MRDDVLRLRDLVLRVVLRRLHDHFVAGRLGGLLEERDVGIQVAERRLLLQHEGDFLRRAGRAGPCGESRGSKRRQAAPQHEARAEFHDHLLPIVLSITMRNIAKMTPNKVESI